MVGFLKYRIDSLLDNRFPIYSEGIAMHNIRRLLQGSRTKYCPNSLLTSMFIWWSMSHMATSAMRAGNSSISMP